VTLLLRIRTIGLKIVRMYSECLVGRFFELGQGSLATRLPSSKKNSPFSVLIHRATEFVLANETRSNDTAPFVGCRLRQSDRFLFPGLTTESRGENQCLLYVSLKAFVDLLVFDGIPPLECGLARLLVAAHLVRRHSRGSRSRHQHRCSPKFWCHFPLGPGSRLS